MPGRFKAVVPALVDILLFYILRTWIDEQPERDGGWPAALTTPGIATALEAIHAEPARPWTVEELGRRAGMSRAAFARRFATLLGEPPLTYLTRWRLQRSAHLLRSSDEPLHVISERGGYTSSFAFAKAFKRTYGIAPGQYRKGAAQQLPQGGEDPRRAGKIRLHITPAPTSTGRCWLCCSSSATPSSPAPGRGSRPPTTSTADGRSHSRRGPTRDAAHRQLEQGAGRCGGRDAEERRRRDAQREGHDEVEQPQHSSRAQRSAG